MDVSGMGMPSVGASLMPETVNIQVSIPDAPDVSVAVNTSVSLPFHSASLIVKLATLSVRSTVTFDPPLTVQEIRLSG